MTNHVKKILEEALSLTESERAILATNLIDSLETENEGNVDKAWDIEFSNRLSQLDSGTSTIPWTEARKKIIEGLG